jgi:acyl carrier protein
VNQVKLSFVDYNNTTPAFNEVADFVRDWARISAKKQITPATQFERDLGITGDDGAELLEAAEKRFNVSLTDGENGYRTIFKLGPNEFLFNSEGFSLGFAGGDIITLFSNPNPIQTVRSFTVGELYGAIQQARSAA